MALAVDNPLSDPNGGFTIFLGNLDYVFNGYFIVEMLIKIFTLGFLFTQRAYMKVTRAGRAGSDGAHTA